MQTPDVVKRAARLSGGKRVRVICKEGVFDLPRLPDIEPPSTTVVRLDDSKINPETSRIVERLAMSVETLSGHVGESVKVFRESVTELQGQQMEFNLQTVRGLDEINATLAAPVRPIYDDKGKLAGAQRQRAG